MLGTSRCVVENLNISGNAMAGIELFDADDGRYGNTIQARIGVVRRDELDSCVYD